MSAPPPFPLPSPFTLAGFPAGLLQLRYQQATAGGAFYSELYAATGCQNQQYRAIVTDAVDWILNQRLPDGTIPYIISPPSPSDHQYQCVSCACVLICAVHLHILLPSKFVLDLLLLRRRARVFAAALCRSHGLLDTASDAHVNIRVCAWRGLVLSTHPRLTVPVAVCWCR